jgi:hypothetical protein
MGRMPRKAPNSPRAASEPASRSEVRQELSRALAASIQGISEQLKVRPSSVSEEAAIVHRQVQPIDDTPRSLPDNRQAAAGVRIHRAGISAEQ